MAEIDNSIYKNMQAPDIIGGVQRGLQYRQQQDALAEQKKQAEAQKQKEKMAFDTQEIAKIVPQVKDQASYDKALVHLHNKGVDVSQVPRAYDPQVVSMYGKAAMSYQEQMAQEWKEKEYKLKEEELNIKRQEANKKANTGDNLPLDSKKIVESLATKNANKTSIKNQIDAVVDNWDSWSEDQKLAMGGQLLKTLNSPEGADAIGAEEAKRLGSKLEFAYGNIFNSNPTQFGRDLAGFKEQAKNTAKSIGEGVLKNQDEINRLMGRPVAERKKEDKPPGFDLTALANIDLNKMDQNSLEAIYKKAGGK